MKMLHQYKSFIYMLDLHGILQRDISSNWQHRKKKKKQTFLITILFKHK